MYRDASASRAGTTASYVATAGAAASARKAGSTCAASTTGVADDALAPAGSSGSGLSSHVTS